MANLIDILKKRLAWLTVQPAHEPNDSAFVTSYLTAYHQQMIADLSEICEQPLDEAGAQKWLKDLLAQNWQKTNNSPLAYTATPDSAMTSLMCELAYDLALAEKNELCDIDVTIPRDTIPTKEVFQLLMPTIDGDSMVHDNKVLGVTFPSFEEDARDIRELLRTHIRGRDERYLVPVRSLIDIEGQSLETIHQLSNHYYPFAADSAYLLIDKSELERLKGHSSDTEFFYDTYIRTMDSDSDGSLYDLLVRARNRMKDGSVSGRHGSAVEHGAAAEAIEGIAILEDGFDSFFKKREVDVNGEVQFALNDPVVINGNTYPGALPAELYGLVDMMNRQRGNHAYSTLTQVVDGEIVTTARRAVHHDDVDTCTNTYQGDLTRYITEHAEALKKVKNPNIDGLREEKIRQLESSRHALLTAIEKQAKTQAIGADKLPVTAAFLEAFKVQVELESLDDLKQLLTSLDIDAIGSLFAQESFQQQFNELVNSPFDWDNLFLFMQASKIKALVSVLPDASLESIFSRYTDHNGINYAGNVTNIHRLFQVGQDIEAKQLAFCEAMASRTTPPQTNLLVAKFLQGFNAERVEDISFWSFFTDNGLLDWKAPVDLNKTQLDYALENGSPYITTGLIEAFAEDSPEFKQVVKQAYDNGWLSRLKQADDCGKDWVNALKLSDESLTCHHNQRNETFFIYLVGKVNDDHLKAVGPRLIVDVFNKNKFSSVRALLARGIKHPLKSFSANWAHTANQFAKGASRYEVGCSKEYVDLVMTFLQQAGTDEQETLRKMVLEAYQEGYIYLASRLVEEGIGLEVKTDEGKTVLMLALEIDNVAQISLGLISTLSDEMLMVTDSSGKTALDYAIQKGFYRYVVPLLNRQTETGEFLYDLSKVSDSSAIFKMLPVEPDYLDLFMKLMAVPELAQTLAISTDGENETKRPNTLLEQWLICAVKAKRGDIAQRLINNTNLKLTGNLQVRDYTGSDYSLSYSGNRSNHTPSSVDCQGLLTIAISLADEQLLFALFETESKPRVSKADIIQLGHPDIIQSCPNAFDAMVRLFQASNPLEAKSLLHAFTGQGNLNALERLLPLLDESSIDELDNDGHLPMYHAVHSGSIDVVQYLSDNQAVLEDLDSNYLLLAAKNNDVAMIRYIAENTERGYLVNNENGETVVEVLLGNRAVDQSLVVEVVSHIDASALKDKGAVALKLAISKKQFLVADLLVAQVAAELIDTVFIKALVDNIGKDYPKYPNATSNNLDAWFVEQEQLDKVLARCFYKVTPPFDRAIYKKLIQHGCIHPLVAMLPIVPVSVINEVIDKKSQGRFRSAKRITLLADKLDRCSQDRGAQVMALALLQHPEIDIGKDKVRVVKLITTPQNIEVKEDLRLQALKRLVQHDKIKLSDSIPGQKQTVLAYLIENNLTELLQEIAADKRRRRQYGRYSAARKTLRGYKPLAAEGGERAVLNPANEDDNWPISQIVGSVSNQGEFDEEEEMEGPSNTISRA